MSKKTLQAWWSPKLFELGMGQVVVARQKAGDAGGIITAGVFLVDAFCLGVKNAFLAKIASSEWESALERMFPDKREALSPACARKLIEGAIAYARSFGLEPHPDFQKASHVLSGIDSGECNTTFTFGQDGKPFYIQGPHDSPGFANRVMASLSKHAGGIKNFHFMAKAEDVDPHSLE
ncbi:MAG TPA: hypothetical protein VN829_15660 [Dongiaceae bacterium]|nr:hypothetical protein [Dongiaceae bacterium]